MSDPSEQTKSRDAAAEPAFDEVAGLIKQHVPHDLLPNDELSARYVAQNLKAATAERNVSGAFNLLLELRRRGRLEQKQLDLVEQLHGSGVSVEFRALDPKSRSAQSYTWRTGTDRTAIAGWLLARDGRSNIYVGINPRDDALTGTTTPGREQHVASRRFVVFDHDHHGAPGNDPTWERVAAKLRGLDPVMQVSSGNGVHTWFEIEPQTPAEATEATAALNAILRDAGSDPVADLPRIIRLPWSINVPSEAKRARGARLALATVQYGPVEPEARRVRPAADLIAAVRQALGLHTVDPAATKPGQQPDKRVKSPHPAPSVEALRLWASNMPNQPGGPFEDRGEWMRVCHAMKGAAIAGGIEAEGRDIWLNWCSPWGGDPDEPARAWDTCSRPQSGWGALMRLMEQINPAGVAALRAAEFSTLAAQEAAANRAMIGSANLAPLQPFAPAQIPPRRFVYGRHAIAGFVSLLVAPGGSGKSALSLVDAVAVASDRELLAGDKPIRTGPVWVHNAEDDRDEMLRRLAALLKHFGMRHADLKGNLILSSGRDVDIQFARMGRNGPEIVPGVVDAIVERTKAVGATMIVFDPLGAMHTLPENSNEAANLLSAALREIAHRTDAAVIVLHHASKAAAVDMDGAGAGASRGASAFVDAARVVRQVVRMTPREAATFGIAEDDRRDYLRVENGKANLARAENARWLRMVDVPLHNGAGLWPLGDRVGVVERWTPPGPVSGTASDLARVQTAILTANERPRHDARSPEWIGYLVAQTLELDIGSRGASTKDRTAAQAGAHARVRSMIDSWLREGGLVRKGERDPKSRKDVAYVVVGTPAVLQDAPAVGDADIDNVQEGD